LSLPPVVMGVNFIIYVADQKASADFYARFLDSAPTLDVPGMTEFTLPGGAVLGLMPIRGIRRLLGDALPGEDWETQTPRCELYLTVSDAAAYFTRAREAGARAVLPVEERDWGHRAGYLLDPDGHVVAVGEAI